MSKPVKPSSTGRRAYDASGRREQARRNRAAVLDAARRRFLADGYAATTVAAIAADAGVSVETVYKAFGNKAGLLKSVFDVAVVGDDEPVPMLQREAVQRVRDEPDARNKLRMYGATLAASAPRAMPVQLLARAAAASDPDAAAVWEQMKAERLFGMTMFGAELFDGGHLRAGVTADNARDVLFLYNSAEVYETLVLGRGWTPARYGEFVAEALIAALLPPRTTK